MRCDYSRHSIGVVDARALSSTETAGKDARCVFLGFSAGRGTPAGSLCANAARCARAIVDIDRVDAECFDRLARSIAIGAASTRRKGRVDVDGCVSTPGRLRAHQALGVMIDRRVDWVSRAT